MIKGEPSRKHGHVDGKQIWIEVEAPKRIFYLHKGEKKYYKSWSETLKALWKKRSRSS
jgi:hypothetical protein